jgi:hypothetical protein
MLTLDDYTGCGAFRQIALRSHILRQGDTNDRWTLTPFDKEGARWGEPLVVADFDGLRGWFERTPRQYTALSKLPKPVQCLERLLSEVGLGGAYSISGLIQVLKAVEALEKRRELVEP